MCVATYVLAFLGWLRRVLTRLTLAATRVTLDILSLNY
jgi:hypothetical protein